jgi:hypothetical protein
MIGHNRCAQVRAEKLMLENRKINDPDIFYLPRIF